MGKGIYTNRICVYSSIFLMLLVQAFGIATSNYVFPLLIYAAFIFIYLFYINKTVLLFLILCTRILLDSIPTVTYPKIALNLSVIEIYTLGLMVFMFSYLLINNGIILDAISKSIILIIASACITTVYHPAHISGFFETATKWIYFVLTYLFFKCLLQNVSIKHVFMVIALIVLYPFLSQVHSIITGAGHLHHGAIRYAGAYDHPNFVANYFLFSVPAAVFLFTNEKKQVLKYFYGVIIILCHIGLIMAGYRTNWFAILIFWAIYIFFLSRRKLLASLIVLLAGLVLFNLFYETITEPLRPFQTILENPSDVIGSAKYDYLLSGRVGLWRYALEAYQQSDLLEKVIGLGFRSTMIGSIAYMHNEYIAAFVEAGIIGLLTLFIWIYFSSKTLFKYANYDKKLSYLILAIFLSLVILSMGTMPFQNVIVINYIAIYLAIGYAKK